MGSVLLRSLPSRTEDIELQPVHTLRERKIRNFANAPHGMAAANFFDDLFLRLNGDGVPLPVGVERAATAYLDGKPLPVGKNKLTKKERHSRFWSSNVVKECPPESKNDEATSLAPARYRGQKPVVAKGLVARVARDAPDALIRAVTHSWPILNPYSARRVELDKAASESEAVAAICRVVNLFALAHCERFAALEARKAQLAGCWSSRSSTTRAFTPSRFWFQGTSR